MLGIGLPEILLVLIICLILFDIKRLPNVARSLGKAVREFRKIQEIFEDNNDESLAG